MTAIDSRSAPTQPIAERHRLRFSSGGETCVASHYGGTNGARVVMAGGGAVPKGPGTVIPQPGDWSRRRSRD